MSAHDRWLANYQTHPAEAYCTNAKCERYGEPVNVVYEEEYGQGTISPEDCATCRGSLSLDAPPELEDDDDDEA